MPAKGNKGKAESAPANQAVPVVPGSISRINREFRSGVMDERTKIQLYLQTLFDPSLLPREYSPASPVKSGTTLMEEVHRYIRSPGADREIVEKARGFLSSFIPALDRQYISPDGYFAIHYTLDGSDAVPPGGDSDGGTPDFIKAIGDSLAYARKVTCGMRGFRQPVSESGKGIFNVYVFNLRGKYGITVPSGYHSTRMYRQQVASCYICMDNEYSPAKGFKTSTEGCIKVTAAHEFFHAVQNAYNADADSWWKEASATWNEDEVYDPVNDYLQYIGDLLSSPGEPLEHSSYSGVVFAKHLSDRFGGYRMIRNIWDAQAYQYRNSINAIDSAIRNNAPGQDLGRVFGGFAATLYNPAQYYREGNLWKQQVAIQNTNSVFPVQQKTGALDHLSSSYELFRPAGITGKTLSISVKGPEGLNCSFKLQKKRASDGYCEETALDIGGEGGREILCESFGDTYSEVCLIPSNLEKDKNGATYTYSASLQ